MHPTSIFPDDGKTIRFKAPKTEEGQYNLEVNGLTGSFVIKGFSKSFPLIIVVIVLLMIEIIGILFFVNFLLSDVERDRKRRL